MKFFLLCWHSIQSSRVQKKKNRGQAGNIYLFLRSSFNKEKKRQPDYTFTFNPEAHSSVVNIRLLVRIKRFLYCFACDVYYNCLIYSNYIMQDNIIIKLLIRAKPVLLWSSAGSMLVYQYQGRIQIHNEAQGQNP
jgi:hypothetical protein